ncbi:MAG: type 4a pilus biogenesis protein PilO [Candidatus Dadabacteria bacterium]|nr:type 4a pilus biogenesis protein PilO [Candidatus Dadabacteria bacterium]
MAFYDEISERLSEQPLHVKLILLLVIVAVISAAYWYFYWSPGRETLERAQRKLASEQKRIKEYEAVADELPAFEKEFGRLEREFELISLKLPKEKEIPALIDSVYSEISGSNLDSIIFAPQGQVAREIYAEIPIQMEVIGGYFNLADFFDRISRLPRIVNVRDLVLSRTDVKGNNVILNAKFNVVTFRLLPRPDTPAVSEKGKGKGKTKSRKKRNTKEEP